MDKIRGYVVVEIASSQHYSSYVIFQWDSIHSESILAELIYKYLFTVCNLERKWTEHRKRFNPVLNMGFCEQFQRPSLCEFMPVSCVQLCADI